MIAITIPLVTNVIALVSLSLGGFSFWFIFFCYLFSFFFFFFGERPRSIGKTFFYTPHLKKEKQAQIIRSKPSFFERKYRISFMSTVSKAAGVMSTCD